MTVIQRSVCLAVTAVASACMVSPAAAAIIVFQDGDSQAFANWSLVSTQGFGGAIVAPIGGPVGGHATAGGVTNSTGVPPATALIYNTGSLVGDYTAGGGFGALGVNGFSAQFWSYQAVGSGPDDFRLYMIAGGYTWYYDMGPLAAGWNYLYANMVHTDDPYFEAFTGWYNEDGRTVADFQADLASVTAIGFELQYLVNQANQSFGFDYIGLYDNYFVPEPETYLVLAVALASLAFVFREQLRQTFGTVLATIKC